MNPVKCFLETLPFFLLLGFSFSSDSITPQHSIEDGDVVVSKGKTFVLGFFSPLNSKFRYVGIWYYQVTEQTVVWVANREKPINDTSGVLSIDSRGNLVLHRQNRANPVWSTNASVTPSRNSVARLYDTGNLVLVQDGTPLWQSFDYPTNTFVFSMKLGLNLSSGLNRFLTSWKSGNDPGIGNYSIRIDPTGFPQMSLYKDSAKVWRVGSWTGIRWTGVPEMAHTHSDVFYANFVNNNEEIYTMMGTKNASLIARVVANETGFMQRYIWNLEDQRWFLLWSVPGEECDKYGYCGPNSNCDRTQAYVNRKKCSCLPGFEPKSPENWNLNDGTAGCIQKPNASICQNGEGFVKVEHVKLPDTDVASADMSLGLKQCEEKCLRNCSCRGYASAYYESNGGTGCLTWHGDLVDMRIFTDAGQDFFLRVDAADLARYRKKNGRLNKKLMVAIVTVSVAVMFCMATYAFCSLCRPRRGRNRRFSKSLLSFKASSTTFEESLDETNAELPLFDLGTMVVATNNFSADNKLGQGGFGHVYKGLLKGKEVAIKRLSKSSGQGIEEFKNEITLIAKLQHRNLVRILGCCVEKEEKMLIYEFMPNKSLDSFIFDSRLRIIHRDLKASNILLDAEMNPKISDFGMARIFGGDQVEAETRRVVGTYGYMAPEYAMQGHFSIKSDVYSFGVLLLEIVTGRKNGGSYPDSPTLSLIGHVWDLWTNHRAIEIIDSSLGNSYPSDQILRCIQIGLLCVQDSATDRPKMSTVVAMLETGANLPPPKHPAFIIKKANQTDETGSFSFSSDSITPQQYIKDGDVVVSTGKTFVLGFFSPGNSKFRYVGIWYYQVTEQTVVWVANRGKPINDTSGVLSIDSQGNLVLHRQNQTDPVWSTNASVTPSNNSIARLYDTDPTGFPQMSLYKDSAKIYRAGSWTGIRWTGVPEMAHTPSDVFYANFVNDNEEIYTMMGTKNASLIARVVANETGFMQRYIWNLEDQRFEPKSPESWNLNDGTAGCIQKPNASICQSGEGFVKVEHVKLPDTNVANADLSLGLKQCEEKCLRNCSCRGYASAYYESNGGTGCLTWHGNLVDMRIFTDAGQDFFLRVDAADLARYRKNNGRLNKKLMVAIVTVLSVAVVFCMATYAFCSRWRTTRGRDRRLSKFLFSFKASSTTFEESLNERNAELPLFDLGTMVAATNNFSVDNKLGQGGFGLVYKGSLKGKEVAIKRLSKSSGQGIEELKNEITLIAKLQHRNLVRILGCCVEKEEKMLIYEFMPNKSLDSFIFDERKRSLLDWGRRYEIICGIARGILYLHQDSRLRIIHRDLKASNILLDAEMNPKISDFGMARIFGGDQVEADTYTNRVVGTYGYMAPEYAMRGHFSIKSDVYSFGVLLLEIVTGRRNGGSLPGSPTLSLIGHVWDLWTNEKAIEIIDSSLGNSYPSNEVLRCIQIGLLCVQDSATDRPKMSAVVAMLESNGNLPSPKYPAFIIMRTDQTDDQTGSTASINKVTFTMPLGR
ncbi:S-locus glycoprotein [Corchorus olitorius]|uniref:non-specific serine/threonine protein kinase n=1 Tax=Corchorus olitorius TaxID=93759 RepID=A0A1R3JDE5_9ROSI|nr:S-locus glycoprotein [Corchorus olitorius]